jgi:hypothetical protein
MLGLPCLNSWLAGAPRKTLTGDPLPGVYRQSFWTSSQDFSIKKGFIGPVMQFVDKLIHSKKNVENIIKSGGRSTIYIQLSGSKNNGCTIKSETLKTLGELGVDLEIEVFP